MLFDLQNAQFNKEMEKIGKEKQRNDQAKNEETEVPLSEEDKGR